MVGMESWYGGGGVMIWWGWSHGMVGVGWGGVIVWWWILGMYSRLKAFGVKLLMQQIIKPFLCGTIVTFKLKYYLVSVYSCILLYIVV